MNAKDYESKRMKELRRYSRMMWFEECELARGRKYFQKFSLLKSYPIRESNNTADAIRNREKLSIPYHPFFGGFPVFRKLYSIASPPH